MPKYTGKTPTKASANGVDYVFIGWDKNLVKVTANTTYKAKYKAVEYLDVDKEIASIISKVHANKFAISKSNKTISVNFTSYTTTNSVGITTTTKPPYKFTDIFYEMLGLLDAISSKSQYKSAELYYKAPKESKGMTIDLTDYDLTDTDYNSWYGGGPNDRVGEWLGYVATGESSTMAAFTSDTSDLVGKTVQLTLKPELGYAFSDGSTSAVFYITFLCK